MLLLVPVVPAFTEAFIPVPDILPELVLAVVLLSEVVPLVPEVELLPLVVVDVVLLVLVPVVPTSVDAVCVDVVPVVETPTPVELFIPVEVSPEVDRVWCVELHDKASAKGNTKNILFICTDFKDTNPIFMP